MKLATLTGLVLMFLISTADANMHGRHGHPNFGGEEAFELILSYTDDETAASLTALRDEIDATRDELRALHEAGDPDDEAVAALREQLKTLRKDLLEQVRGIVEVNDDLKADLRELRRNARQERFAGRFGLRNEAGFNEVVAAADPEQAAALTDNQGQIDALRAELHAARDAGATREDVQGIAMQLRTLRDEQRDLVSAVLDANEELRDSLIEQARAARQEMRDEMREKRPRRKRHPGG